jgi:TPR repeat protein
MTDYFVVHGLNVGDDVLSRAKLGGGFSLAKIADIYYEKKDYTRAFDWYRLDAANNMSYAQLRVGSMYHHGEGVSVDYKLAMEWYMKARDNGNPAAANYIREMHGGGLSVTESSEQDYQPGQESKKRLNDKGYYIYDIQKSKCLYLYEATFILITFILLQNSIK